MKPVVLFDGVCNLCNRSVDFIIRHDPVGLIRFAPLQSEAGERLAKEAGLEGISGDTIVLLDGSGAWTQSTAALRIARRLEPPYRYLYALRIVPRPVRDWAYRLVARNRYRWFGRRDTCRLPAPEERERFLL